MSENKSYHFDIGNSSTGKLGMCARVNATTRHRALMKLRSRLGDGTVVVMQNQVAGEYIHVYVNADAICIHDINEDMTEPVEEPDAGPDHQV